MAKNKSKDKSEILPKLPPAVSLEARESQLIALAYDVAEQRLRDGTATSQEVTHFLKLGSTKDRIEKEILERQKELITSKTEALQAQMRLESMFTEAMEAFKNYSGQSSGDDNGQDIF